MTDARTVEREELYRRLVEIGISLSTETQLGRFLEQVLESARELTGADAGSLYLVEEGYLVFQLAQNESVPLHHLPGKRFPISARSIAGWVALQGTPLRLNDVQEIPEDAPYQFSREWSRRIGYPVRSMLTVPLRHPERGTVGVLQVLNKKSRPGPLPLEGDWKEVVRPFEEEDERLLMALAGLAGASLVQRRLVDELNQAFQLFVEASVLALDQRDPSTKGHSLRVARMMRAFAEKLSAHDSGAYADVRFSEQEIQAIYYASLLHDYGKITISETILTKREKLHPYEKERILSRLRILRALAEADLVRISRERLESWRALVERVSRKEGPPSEEERTELEEMARVTLPDTGEPLLRDEELRLLLLPYGTLAPDERREIQGHVERGHAILARIPWPSHLRIIPQIALLHHEKLDGSGYPMGLRGDQIPLLVRMLTIVDIFDALTCFDRPYRAPCSPEEALAILNEEAQKGRLDAELVDLVREWRLWEGIPRQEEAFL